MAIPIVFKALHFSNWPPYLKLDLHISGRTLRLSNERTLKVPLETGTFQDSASRIFNTLPSASRNSEAFNLFKGEVRKFLDIKTIKTFSEKQCSINLAKFLDLVIWILQY